MTNNINLTTAVTKLNNQSLTESYSSKQCSKCGVQAPHFLHQVNHLGKYCRLCTSCVLRLHSSSFCPVCFTFYSGSPPLPSKRIPCSNCSSFTHSYCSAHTVFSPYLCPPCKDSSFSFFSLKDNKIDKSLALALLCAAKISDFSIGKAVTTTRADADRKVKEAALARKRARDALEHLLQLTNENKVARKNEINFCSDANVAAKIEDFDVDNGEADADDDNDGEIDVDLVRHIEDSLIKVEDIGS